MPEMPNVITGETIEAEWGNDIRDRTIQRYDNRTTRTAEHPTPVTGDLSFLEDTGDVDLYFSGAWRHLNGPPTGSIVDHGGGPVPPGWLVCNGSEVSRTTYPELFAQIGVIWGAGDGSTTFNLPDLRGRYRRGTAASGTGDAVGETFGADTLANHLHTVDPPTTTSSFEDTATVAVSQSVAHIGTPSASELGIAQDDHDHSVNIASFNSGNPTTAPAILPASAAVTVLIRA
jgi:microcystin-dependent protein